MIQPFLQPQAPKKRNILSVSELNKQTKNALESNFSSIWLTGEISNLVQAASGHWYFSLKDSAAQIRCAMFRFKTQNLRLSPNNGDKVIVKGKVSLYEPRGDYQLIADFMEAAGQGNLQQKLNALIHKLSAEGIFAEERKQKLPQFPQKIGVITSPTGAAIHDVLSVLKRRCPMIPIIIYPTQVQGNDAVQSVLNAITVAEKRDECDVLLITRGGGSLEDLWAFNDEQLAHRIVNCQIPLVAAIGHEVDTTITELAADLRAPTPSAAAELLVPDQTTLQQRVDQFNMALTSIIKNTIHLRQVQLNITRLKLAGPANTITTSQLQVEKLNHLLTNTIKHKLEKDKNTLENLNRKLLQLNPAVTLNNKQQKVSALKQQLHTSIQQQLQHYQHQLQINAGTLETLSPLSTLSRGYAIVRDTQTKQVISQTKQFTQGQTISLLLSDGNATCSVEKINDTQTT